MATKPSSTSGPNALVAMCDAMESGTTKNIVGNATVTIVESAMTAVQINAKLGQADTLYGAVNTARAALKLALAAWTAAEPALRQFVKDYEQALKGVFGSNSPKLADFGIIVKSKAAPSAETKAKAVAQRRQTTAVRGPTGKARQAITTQGSPGLVLVSPTGQPIPGALAGPTPPGSGTPAAVNLVPAGTTGGGTTPASTPPAGSGGTTPTK